MGSKKKLGLKKLTQKFEEEHGTTNSAFVAYQMS
jgi:hypothetical protein